MNKCTICEQDSVHVLPLIDPGNMAAKASSSDLKCSCLSNHRKQKWNPRPFQSLHASPSCAATLNRISIRDNASKMAMHLTRLSVEAEQSTQPRNVTPGWSPRQDKVFSSNHSCYIPAISWKVTHSGLLVNSFLFCSPFFIIFLCYFFSWIIISCFPFLLSLFCATSFLESLIAGLFHKWVINEADTSNRLTGNNVFTLIRVVNCLIGHQSIGVMATEEIEREKNYIFWCRIKIAQAQSEHPYHE